MNLSRLVVLGLLESGGPQHGHEIRRQAERSNVQTWGGVSIGALHRELRTMETQDLVEAVRTEQVGRRPVRTVYRITEDGRTELHTLREKAISQLHFGPDPLGVALLFGRVGDRAEMLALLAGRREVLAVSRDGVAAECRRLTEQGLITAFDAAMFRRREMQLDAELRWLEQFEKDVADIPDSGPAADAERAEPADQPTEEKP
ncbi:PadR family transcriptional regulator [Streptomyces sp. NBC_01340]|uniref:PadR family transcriptional regulator n=1 Tax=Streptomyces TaxID=1883 RepID=UPI002250B22A|nr:MULTISPECIES: PadR family transcriptional regulator [unclassified Streptomyces]MCX4457432.1 PadR family transcriptional regulator [Streptomyces sp. NBC_01719]MCX4496789.1 PadR family transcriptional regulator [Streptomyces sp. NBC_01728]WSI41672.1 PadR family transcriptional regulator [Streptomyces sp. NBC_01340]